MKMTAPFKAIACEFKDAKELAQKSPKPAAFFGLAGCAIATLALLPPVGTSVATAFSGFALIIDENSLAPSPRKSFKHTVGGITLIAGGIPTSYYTFKPIVAALGIG